MAVTHRTPPNAPHKDAGSTGSSVGFVLVVVAAVVAALGVMQLEIHGAPWPMTPQSAQPANPGANLQAPRLLPDMRQARALRSEAASASGRFYRTGDPSGQ